MNPEDPLLAADLLRVDRDRFLTASFAPRSRRTGIWALLAFNAELARVRESVTQPLMGQMRLQWWRDVLETIYSDNTVRRHPVAQGLANAVADYRLSRRNLQELVDARERDLIETPPADFEELIRYAARTGGALSLARLEVLSARAEAADAAATAIGTAWALTGILRAIPFHARFRRILIPAPLLAETNIDIEGLFAGQPQPRLSEAVEVMWSVAARYLEEGRVLHATVSRKALPVLIEARLAAIYLKRLKAARFDPLQKEVASAIPKAAWHLLVGYLTTRY